MGKIEFTAAIPIDILRGSQPTVNSTNINYTDSFVLTRHRAYSLEVQFYSDTDVNVKIDLEQGNERPSVERSASSVFVGTIDTLKTVADEDVHILPVCPVVSVYGRLKLTGVDGNSNTTVLTKAKWVEVEV